MNPVIVEPNFEGTGVINPSKNFEYGYIKLSQKRFIFTPNKFVKSNKLTALLHGKIIDLEEMNLKPYQKIRGKIIIVESLQPPNINNPEDSLKKILDSDIVCKYKGMPIYRDTMYVEDENAFDELIPHDNYEEIKKSLENRSIQEINLF